jgi:predicted nucleic acid-binding protein
MASRESGNETASSTALPPLHVLVDTNVVLDLLLARQPWLTEAQSMWEARDAGGLFAHVPASALTDIFYICRKVVGVNQAKRAVDACLQGFTIITVTRHILAMALALPGSDFEDNVQIACAQSAGLDLIVTRNVADFVHSPILAVEPFAAVCHVQRGIDGRR